ncbi:MAG TPA: tripartite tricarboxylate transporter substrate binding protein [Burkholderiales bacterium]|nr:tripartite tricarboxylate transporter substrate binding protein [Burkholderiales bacterium]
MRAVLILLLATVAAAASAQEYPAKVVTVIVPFPAGGPTDQVARVLAAKFTEKLGQPFVVENVSGGNTIIATGRLARATPDGHTLLVHNLQISANVGLYAGKLPYDTERDIVPVGFINHNPLVLVGRKALAPNTLPELIAYMRKSSLNFAHPGVGTTGYITTALFLQATKLDALLVPYRGAAPALQDMVGNHVDLFFTTPQSVLQLIAAGQLKAYCITAKEPYAQFPGVASLVDEYGPKLEIHYWHALFAPAATPQVAIENLNAALQAVLDDPAIVKSWASSGVLPYAKDQRSPQAARALFKSEIARWGEVVRENRIQPVD